jgi:hypothetical protein
MNDMLSPFPEMGFLHASAGRQRSPRPRLAVAEPHSDPELMPVPVLLTTHQIALLDEWIEDRPDPRLTRGQALAFQFDWSIARCASMIDVHPRSTVAGEIAGEHML